MKKRLDTILVEKGFVNSKHKAQRLIMEGVVFVNNVKIDKPGKKFSDDVKIFIKEKLKYVSRGGLKLEHALNYFKINVKDKICMDIGASTGGFTHCLLEFGAKKVYAIDVGYGQLDYFLRNDKRVVNIERCNFRYIEKDKIPEQVDLITIDVSFISLKLIIPKALQFLKKSGEIIALIKPQFEVGKNEVEKGGVIRDEKKHEKVLKDFEKFFSSINLNLIGFVQSPILGQKGNKEFFAYLKKEKFNDFNTIDNNN